MNLWNNPSLAKDYFYPTEPGYHNVTNTLRDMPTRSIVMAFERNMNANLQDPMASNQMVTGSKQAENLIPSLLRNINANPFHSLAF